jgi:XTP/dITP diphosphohydrolase
MMKIKELIFATGNKHKAEEASRILGFTVQTATDEIVKNTPEETGSTFRENALIKAMYLYETTGMPCFSEDSGLEVESLGGQPGVKTARFAGDNATHESNNLLLLEKLKHDKNRHAQFVACICYINTKGEATFFEGIVRGTIAEKICGTEGFGYDPVFIPEGFSQSFAELGPKIKDKISHRKIALQHLKEYLLNHE